MYTTLFRKRRLIATVLIMLLLGVLFLIQSSLEPSLKISLEPSHREHQLDDLREAEALRTLLQSWTDDEPMHAISKPLPLASNETHPIQYLATKAQQEFGQVLERQSKTMDEAVKEYHRRYGLSPPPHFDKWFQFATDNSTQLIDEFDTIYDLITPFWGMKPKTIRSCAREALGYDNGLMGVAIRKHKVAFTEVPDDYTWQLNATMSMLAKFIKYLPDMDLAFNIHDEPRVVLQHDDLARLVRKAKHENIPASNTESPINEFTINVLDLGSKFKFEKVNQTRFRSAAHQPAWAPSRMSCPPHSPARILDDDELGDDIHKYILTSGGFIYNSTAMMDICLSPSLSTAFGFFERPNGYNVAHDLFPIFSQSKISSYSDIIYPSPWYWGEKVLYNETRDFPWDEKHSQLYWRGSTTGGFSHHGGWRRQHRQHLVHHINKGQGNDRSYVNDKENAVNEKQNAKSTMDGIKNDKPSQGINDIGVDDQNPINVHFSHVGQCDPDDCQDQVKFFNVKEIVDMQDAWGYKFLLDMDGNAFSGRFYAFLKSRSQVFKQAIFQEWHMEWLKPWLHYAPLSMQGDDWIELVRHYRDSKGEAQAMAKMSTEWAGKTLRKVDLEAWLFRLLLEYARVIDDNRAEIGFDPSTADGVLGTEGKST